MRRSTVFEAFFEKRPIVGRSNILEGTANILIKASQLVLSQAWTTVTSWSVRRSS